MSKGNRQHFIPDYLAEDIDDAELLAPNWTTHIAEVDGGYMCYEKEPEQDVWLGREHF